MKDHGGLLARAAKLHDESLLRESESLTNEDAVLAYYPCLPYHVRLLQAILTAFRGEKQVDQTAAQSRALLTAIRMLFVKQNGANLAEGELGALVTFDRVYDVIREVVRKADSVTDQLIMQTIEPSLGSCGTIKVSSVAKVILLLQHLNPPGHRRIKVDAENIAALLYPRLGTLWEPHLKDVREACASLLNEHFIGEEPESGYRLYRQEERTFQQEVDTQPVDEAKLYGLLRGAIEKQAASLGMKSVTVNAWHKLPVNVVVHVGAVALPDPNAKPNSLELHMVWPKATAPPQQPKLWAAQYMGATHLAIWYLTGNSDAEDLVRKALKLEAAIKEYANRYGQQAIEFLRSEQTKLDALREESIPQAIENAITSGVVIYRGVDKDLVGQSQKPQDIFKATLKRAVEQVFTQIDIGSVQVDEAGLKKVFSWKPPQAQPDFFSMLRLFDADGHPLVDRPFLKEISLALQGRPENERVGNALIEHFEAPPYGWPERAVKAGIAALLRGRRLIVKLADGTILRTPTDPKAENWLVGTQMFGKAVLELSDLTITPTERETLMQVFAEVFEAPGADTVEKLEKEAQNVLPNYLARAREAFADLNGRQLPGATTLKTLVTVLETATEPDLPVGMLKQLVAKTREVGTVGDTAVTTLKPLTDLLRTVERLRTQGKLDTLASVRMRATALYPLWEASVDGRPVVSDIEELRLQATTEKLVIDADQAIQRDSRCFASYAADYRARHDERHKCALAALAELEAREGWGRVAESLQIQLRNPIATLDCNSQAALTLPASACQGCGRTLKDLQTDIELIEYRLQQALRTLEEATAPKPQPRPQAAQTITMDVRSPADLPHLYERISEVAKTALAQPCRVRVIFENVDES